MWRAHETLQIMRQDKSWVNVGDTRGLQGKGIWLSCCFDSPIVIARVLDDLDDVVPPPSCPDDQPVCGHR